MVKIIIDTNAILRFLLNDISSQHTETLELVKKAQKKKLKIIIPEIVVFETYFTLKSYYKFEKEKLLKILESLLSADYLIVEDKQIFMEAVRIFRNSNLDFVDCFMVSNSKFMGLNLFTFDKDLKKYLAKK